MKIEKILENVRKIILQGGRNINCSTIIDYMKNALKRMLMNLKE